MTYLICHPGSKPDGIGSRCLPREHEGFWPLTLAIGDFFQAATRRPRSILVCYASSLPFPTVAMFDEEPVVSIAPIAFSILAHTNQHPAALQLRPRENELQISFPEGTLGIASILRSPEAPVPKHDGAAAVLALRDGAFEISIVERVVLNLNR